MTDLMQTIFEELCTQLDRYIDGFQRDAYDQKLDRLHGALCSLLPETGRELLNQYKLFLRARSLLETEAMFQAAFAAARELA